MQRLECIRVRVKKCQHAHSTCSDIANSKCNEKKAKLERTDQKGNDTRRDDENEQSGVYVLHFLLSFYHFIRTIPLSL